MTGPPHYRQPQLDMQVQQVRQADSWRFASCQQTCSSLLPPPPTTRDSWVTISLRVS